MDVDLRIDDGGVVGMVVGGGAEAVCEKYCKFEEENTEGEDSPPSFTALHSTIIKLAIIRCFPSIASAICDRG